MSFFQSLILGIVQGLSEFLPISSSGHLILFPALFGWRDQGLAFDVVLHLGTLVAVVYYFRFRLLAIWRGMLRTTPVSTPSFSGLPLLLFISIIPAAIAGLLLDNVIETRLRNPLTVAFSLIVWGGVLWLADIFSRKTKRKTKHLTDLGIKEALWIGFAQALALIPGTSRSGITISAGLFARVSRRTAAEFSFLMSIPVIALAGLFEFIHLPQTGFGNIGIFALLVGFLSSALTGFFAIWLLMRLITTRGLLPFVLYRVVLGIAILLMFF